MASKSKICWVGEIDRWQNLTLSYAEDNGFRVSGVQNCQKKIVGGGEASIKSFPYIIKQMKTLPGVFSL